jgi:hypothetical protein
MLDGLRLYWIWPAPAARQADSGDQSLAAGTIALTPNPLS